MILIIAISLSEYGYQATFVIFLMFLLLFFCWDYASLELNSSGL